MNEKDQFIEEVVKYLDSNGWDSNINHIDVSKVDDMSFLFRLSHFNGDISQWNVEHVTNMNYMFFVSKFNGNLNKWKPRSLINFDFIFDESPLIYNPPIWYKCLKLGLFKSGEDYCDSLKYDWLREDKIVFGRLKSAIKDFEGDPTHINVLRGHLMVN